MDDLSKWSELCVAVGPIVRAAVRRVSGRHRLRPCDRDDLEQEIYLGLLAAQDADLLAFRRGEPPAGTAPHGPREGGDHSATLHAYLTCEVDRLAESLVRSWRLSRRNRWLAQSAASVLVARLSPCRPDAHDLRLDLAVTLARLPEGLRELCYRLILVDLTPATEARPQQPDADALAELAAVAAVPRPLFVSLDLHHYL